MDTIKYLIEQIKHDAKLGIIAVSFVVIMILGTLVGIFYNKVENRDIATKQLELGYERKIDSLNAVILTQQQTYNKETIGRADVAIQELKNEIERQRKINQEQLETNNKNKKILNSNKTKLKRLENETNN